MGIIRIRDPDEIRPVHVVMLVVATLALAANCWLTSAAKPTVLPDGAKEWRADSLMLAVVELLNLNYAQPTPKGVAVKSLATTCAAGIGVLIAGVVIAARSGGLDRVEQSDTVIDLGQQAGDRQTAKDSKKHIDPVAAGQLMLAVTVSWALASALWSPTPGFALNAAILFAAQAAWAFALSVVVNRRMATYIAYLLIAIVAVTGLLAILYHGERNPILRASYPIGNPILLSTYLGVGITMSLALIPQVAGDIASKRRMRGAMRLILAIIVIAIAVCACYLSYSRGPVIGVAIGALAIPFLLLNRQGKLIVSGIALTLLIAVAVLAVYGRDGASPTGRNTTIRVRLYAWSYALDLLGRHPITGLGQGGFTLQGDALAATQVERDPAALMDRISHAHNEWIQVGAELGVVGMVTMVGGLILTLYAGALAVSRRTGAQRWVLVGLVAALVSAIVAESTGVALRVEGFSLVFYTLVGLIWVLAGRDASWFDVLSRRKSFAGLALIASIAVGLVFAESGRRDFSAARAAGDAKSALENEQPAKAVELLQSRTEHRLRPVRRLTAQRLLAQAHLGFADQLQARCFRRINMAMSGSADGPLLGLAHQDRADCMAQIEKGEALVRRIQIAAPDGFSTGWIDAGLKRIRAAFAQADGDASAADLHRRSAAAALLGQLRRNPFVPAVASAYVLTAATDIELSEVLTMLAKPLRVNRIPATYADILANIEYDPRFAQQVELIKATARDCAQLDYAQWPDPWAPEKLRLIGAAYFSTNRLADAVEALQFADSLYPKLDLPAALAAASCKAERADAVFATDPTAPDKAIEIAEQARRSAPNSQPGRALQSDLDARMVIYHLAADREDHAREHAMSAGLVGDPQQIDAYLGRAYVSLGYELFNFFERRDPEPLARWSKRALELNDQQEGGWFLAADVALLTANEARAVQCIREVIKQSSDPQNIVALVERARRALPDSDAIKQISDQMREELGLPPEQSNPPNP